MKNKEKTILCVLIATVFLVPVMGNTVLSESRDIVITTYHFDHHDENEEWQTNPGYMVDGNEQTYASTTIDGDVELCDENTLHVVPARYSILKVELRANGSHGPWGSQADIILRPVFNGTTDGLNYTFETPAGGPPGEWSEWFDITNDPNGPGERNWTWQDIGYLDCDVEANGTSPFAFIVWCSIVQIRVTYTVP